MGGAVVIEVGPFGGDEEGDESGGGFAPAVEGGAVDAGVDAGAGFGEAFFGDEAADEGGDLGIVRRVVGEDGRGSDRGRSAGGDGAFSARYFVGGRMRIWHPATIPVVFQ